MDMNTTLYMAMAQTTTRTLGSPNSTPTWKLDPESGEDTLSKPISEFNMIKQA
jgi:hypothetical protein